MCLDVDVEKGMRSGRIVALHLLLLDRPARTVPPSSLGELLPPLNSSPFLPLPFPFDATRAAASAAKLRAGIRPWAAALRFLHRCSASPGPISFVVVKSEGSTTNGPCWRLQRT
jgi:hypothetical protein